MEFSYHLARQESTQPSPSHIYIGEYKITPSPDQTVDGFKDSIRDQIESLPLESWRAHADSVEVRVYKVVRSRGLSELPLTVVLQCSKPLSGKWEKRITKILESSNLLGDGAVLTVHHLATLIVILGAFFLQSVVRRS